MFLAGTWHATKQYKIIDILLKQAEAGESYIISPEGQFIAHNRGGRNTSDVQRSQNCSKKVDKQ